MGKVRSMKYAVLLLHFFANFALASSLNYTESRRVSELRLARIHRHLKKINKPAVVTIQSPDGDIIDCISRRNQPALDHPALKNHKIQPVPSEMPKGVKRWKSGGSGVWQTWHGNGTTCPKGTVPVRRTSAEDVLRAKSIFDFAKKKRGPGAAPRSIRVDPPDVASGSGHEHAIVYTSASDEVYGARATINVWEPSIEEVNEFSLSQIWVLSGSFDGSDLNSLEAGWQASPELYGDSKPRLFTYWTTDSYEATGCYNLLCAGFVQTNNRVAIGAAISPVSSISGSQYDITILIWKDQRVGNWWMSFGDNEIVGYWPAELFTHLAKHATMVEWGGEVVNSWPDGMHTSTQMGSGHFPIEGFRKASYFRNLEVVDSDNSLSSPQEIFSLAENDNCYDIRSSRNSEWGVHFYYGGPGRNPNCP